MLSIFICMDYSREDRNPQWAVLLCPALSISQTFFGRLISKDRRSAIAARALRVWMSDYLSEGVAESRAVKFSTVSGLGFGGGAVY